MSPTIDFSSVKGLEPIPAGTYTAELVFAEAKTSKKGQPKIDVRYKIVGGEQDGRQLFDSLSFHPNALWRTKKTLQALGFKKDFSGEVEPDDLVGAIVTIKVDIEDREGTDEDGEPYGPRNIIRKVSPAGTSLDNLIG